jgi:ankyrin repeat protein
VAGDRDLLTFMRAIADDDTATATRLLATMPELATVRLLTNATRATAEDFFIGHLHMQLYSGDTALHVAAAAYNTEFAEILMAAGADVRARNRRGAEPIHAAVIGAPGSSSWAPQRQAAMIRYLIEAGADPETTAAGGVTPLLRAVRNRCSAAVRALLDAGVDPARTNDKGSSPLDLARVTSGRGGTGSPEAKAEQARIIRMLESPEATPAHGA